jgi:hypothetical protein
VAMTVEELESWLRRLVAKYHFDDRFLVCGQLHEISDILRRAAEPESRAEAVEVCLSLIAQVDAPL